jgi:hypothetical protein
MSETRQAHPAGEPPAAELTLKNNSTPPRLFPGGNVECNWIINWRLNQDDPFLSPRWFGVASEGSVTAGMGTAGSMTMRQLPSAIMEGATPWLTEIPTTIGAEGIRAYAGTSVFNCFTGACGYLRYFMNPTFLYPLAAVEALDLVRNAVTNSDCPC